MINKTKTYLVLNPCASPVAVSTRDGSYIIPGGSHDVPGSYPFSIEEIIQINSGSPIFRTGFLYFEPEYEKDIYAELRIRDWENILRDTDIEDIILNPTIEKLQKIIDIDSDFYFERVYGIYIGLKSANYAIPGNVQTVFNTRHKELKNGKRKSNIVLTKKETNKDDEVEALRAQLEEMKQMMATLTAEKAEAKNSSDKDDTAKPKTESSAKSTKTRTSTTKNKPKSKK